MTQDLLSSHIKQAEKRCVELEPAVSEFNSLQQYLNILVDAGLAGSDDVTAAPAQRTSEKEKAAPVKAKAVAAKPAASGSKKRGRPAGSGKRDKQVVRAVSANPGLSVSEIAAKLKMKPNYLYHVTDSLQKKQLISKLDGKLFPTTS